MEQFFNSVIKTPKVKALELYNKMAVEWVDGTSSYPNLAPDFRIPKNPYVKQCALTAVDELIDSNPTTSYWKQVKQEIEKL